MMTGGLCSDGGWTCGSRWPELPVLAWTIGDGPQGRRSDEASHGSELGAGSRSDGQWANFPVAVVLTL